MNILIISPYVPHPHSGHGGGEYVYGLVKYLSRSHTVSLATFADQHEQRLLQDVRALPITIHTVDRLKRDRKNLLIDAYLLLNRSWKLILSVFLWQPYMVAKYKNRSMATLVERLTTDRKFDVVQIEFAQMGQYVRHVCSGKTFLRAHDVVFRPSYRRYKTATHPFRKFLNYIEFCRWHRYETGLAREFGHILTFTEQDALLLKRLSGISHVSCNPRGIEVPEKVVGYSTRIPFTMLFIGTLDLYSNADAAQWLCEEIFPIVAKEIPESVLYLAGKNPSGSLLAAAAKHPGIKVLGFVKDIDRYLNTAGVFVAPIRIGGGIKTKILHAASFEIPVVSTSRGAEGIEGLDNSNILIANDSQGFAASIIRFMRNRNMASDFANRCRKIIVKNYAWESVVRKMVIEFEHSIAGK